MALRPVPLNLVTLYADLVQNVRAEAAAYGSVVTRTRGRHQYLYVVSKDGNVRDERYIGPADDPVAMSEAQQIRSAAQQARSNRTAVSLLKRARIPAPSLPLGRAIEVIANAGLFERGIVLIGTAAFQVYAPLVGVYLPAAAAMTSDADILAASLILSGSPIDLEMVLRRADPTFAAEYARDDRLPKLYRAANGLSVDVVTKFGRGRVSPVQIPSLACSAEALTYMEYLASDSMEAVVLYGAGVLVRVPPPARFAVHKLLVAQERRGRFLAKRGKDLIQSRDLMAALRIGDAISLDEAMADARRRGPAWRKAIDASLSEIDRLP